MKTDIIVGGGEMGKRIRAFNWKKTGLGPIPEWPQSLLTAVNTVLQSPVPLVMLWGQDGIMIYNDAYSVFAGQRHPFLLGSKVVEGWPEVADFNRNVMKTGLKGKTLSYKNQKLTLYRNNVPEEVWMDLNYSPIIDESSKPAGVLAIVIETTKRVLAEKNQKHAEDALQSERDRLLSLLMQAPAIITVLKGPKHIYELANAQYMQLVGIKRDIIGKPIRKALPELKGQGFYELLDTVYSTGKPYFGNEALVKLDKKGDGTLENRYVNFVYQPFRNPSGKVEGILVHAVDVTEQVLARKIVEESENRFKTLLQQGSDAIQLVNADGEVIFSSASIKQVLGYSPDELRGRQILPYLHPDDLGYFTKQFKQVLHNPRKTFVLQYRVKHKDGSWAWIEVNAANHLKTPGINALVGNFHNITKRRKDEERQLFLEKINRALFTSFDDALTLQKVAELIVPAIADICRIAIIDNDNKIKEIVANHTDPNKVRLVFDLYDNYKNDAKSTHGIPNLLKTGKPEMISRLDQSVLRTVKNNPKLLKIVKNIGIKSYMGVPLIARNKVIGAMVASSIQNDRFYNQEDLLFIEEIGRRIALALDNARLYNEANRLKIEAENEKNRLTYGQKAGKIGTYEWDLLTNKSTWTKEFEAVYGYPNGGYKAGSTEEWIKYLHPEDRKVVLDKTAKALRKGAELNMEYRVIWPDKSLHYIANRAQIIRNKKGKPIRINGVNIDITERKLIENNMHYLAEVSKALSSSLDYKTTLATVVKLTVPKIADWCSVEIKTDKGLEQLAIAHTDPKKVKWAKELRRKDPPDLNAPNGVGKVLRTGIAEFFPALTDELILKAAKNNEQAKLLKKLSVSSIMIVPLSIGKEVIGAMTFVAAESGRQYSKADLSMAMEVASRAALAIDNSRLYTNSQKAIATRDEFISVASHELKTPVTSLKMYTQVLQKEFENKGEERVSNSLMKMDAQVNKLTVLIGDLLNVSKLQLGKLEFHQEEFDIHEVLNDVVETVQQTTKKHLIQTNGVLKSRVWGDKDRIGQVLANLLTNAIKYSPKAKKIIVDLTSKKDYAVVTVHDFGIGIDNEHLSRLFNRFYRVTGAEEKTYPGLGLGLYISNEIVKRHGGKMSVVSKKGKGSKFSFTIPYKKVPGDNFL